MSKIVYITRHDNSIETLTFNDKNINQRKEFVYLLHELAETNDYVRVTIQNIE